MTTKQMVWAAIVYNIIVLITAAALLYAYRQNIKELFDAVATLNYTISLTEKQTNSNKKTISAHTAELVSIGNEIVYYEPLAMRN